MKINIEDIINQSFSNFIASFIGIITGIIVSKIPLKIRYFSVKKLIIKGIIEFYDNVCDYYDYYKSSLENGGDITIFQQRENDKKK